MKIISKFQDYYDCGIAYGIDEKIRFDRQTKFIDEKFASLHYKVYKFLMDNSWYRLIQTKNYIGFCGKVIPYIYIKIEKITKVNKKNQYKFVQEYFCYDIYEYLEIFKKYFLGNELFDRTYNCTFYKKAIKFDIKKVKKDIDNFFDDNTNEKEYLFLKYKVPYFANYLITENKDNKLFFKQNFVLLPKLKDFKFSKKVSALEAFQEISMYVAWLQNQEVDTKIDDKYLLKAKGFDCYSFKKNPTKRTKKIC